MKDPASPSRKIVSPDLNSRMSVSRRRISKVGMRVVFLGTCHETYYLNVELISNP